MCVYILNAFTREVILSRQGSTTLIAFVDEIAERAIIADLHSDRLMKFTVCMNFSHRHQRINAEFIL